MTTYDALCRTDAVPGDPVAVLGVGGLGRLGVRVVLATAASAAAMAATVGGLRPRGQLVTVGVSPDPLPIRSMQLIMPGPSIIGHPSGTSRDVEETMHFAVQTAVRAMVEETPLARAAEAYPPWTKDGRVTAGS